jgi:hypothetical protein
MCGSKWVLESSLWNDEQQRCKQCDAGVYAFKHKKCYTTRTLSIKVTKEDRDEDHDEDEDRDEDEDEDKDDDGTSFVDEYLWDVSAPPVLPAFKEPLNAKQQQSCSKSNRLLSFF